MKRLFSFAFAVLVSGLLVVPATAATTGSADPLKTTISTSKTSVNADGIDQATITVRARTVNLLSASGAAIKLTSSRGILDEITPAEGTTNDFGKATFDVRSLKNGNSTIYADLNGQRVPVSVDVSFVNGLALDLPPGSLIKIPSDSDPNTYSDTAVYYFASNGRRYVFPNEKVYFTWYSSFDNVRVLSLEDMTKIPIGGNVTYHPGVKPVKFQTDDKVYAVDHNGLLRWLKTEDVARHAFGDDWARKTDDISEAFYINYTFGNPLTNALDFMAETIRNKYDSIEKDKGI
jgi:hypothetical protein